MADSKSSKSKEADADARWAQTSAKQDLEAAFDTQFRRLADGLPEPESQHQFHPTRKWKLDRAWPDHKLAVEIEGGANPRTIRCHNCKQTVRAKTAKGFGKPLRIGGWHTTSRYLKDIEKYNALQELGWHLLRYTHKDIHADPFSMVEQIRAVLELRGDEVSLIEDLTDREREVLCMIAAGFNSAETADRLDMSKHSVRTKVQGVCQKLVVRSRPAAVARAMAWGLINPADVPWPDPD